MDTIQQETQTEISKWSKSNAVFTTGVYFRQHCSLGCLFLTAMFNGVCVPDRGVHWGVCSRQQYSLGCFFQTAVFTEVFVPESSTHWVFLGFFFQTAVFTGVFLPDSSIHWGVSSREQCSLGCLLQADYTALKQTSHCRSS